MMTLKDRSSSVLSINKTLVHFYYTSIESILLYSIYHYLSMVCVCVCVCVTWYIYICLYFIYIKQSLLLHWTIQVKLMPMYVCDFAKFCPDWDLNHYNNHTGSAVKNMPANAGDMGRAPGGGNGNLLKYSSWDIPWTEKPGGLQFTGMQESDTSVRLNNTNKPQRQTHLTRVFV